MKFNLCKIFFPAFALLFFLFGCKKVSVEVTPPINTDTAHTVDQNYYTVSGLSDSLPTGEIFLTENAPTNGMLLILNQNGYVIKEKPLPVNVQNLQKWVINGQTRYTYFYTTLVTPGWGYENICDSNFNVLSTVRLLSYGNIDSSVSDELDEHEFILLGDNHYISEAYYVENPSNIPDSLHPSPKVKVDACIIQEVNNGQVIFQWDGTQYPELYASSVQNNNFSDSVDVLDYMHMNSIAIDSADNNLIVSFRNCNEIVKLNRTTGAIIWRLGGHNSDFYQTPDELFLHQHYPRLIENSQTLIFVDNGDITLRPYSRILEFHLDEVNKVITRFSFFNVPDDFIQFAGSVKKEGDDYFIGGGSSPYSLEVNYITNQKLLRINQKYASYRAIKY